VKGANASIMALTTVNGLTVFTAQLTGNGEETIDLSDLAKGTYFISFENETQKTIEKVVLD
jgi:hypothetical protein